MSKNEKTRKYIIYFRFTVLLLALAIPVIFNIYNYYSGTDYWIITLDVAPLFIGFTIWLLIPYIILIGISFFWKKIAQLFGAGALMLTVEFLINLSSAQDVLLFLVLPILQAIIILPIGMGLGFIASFLIKNYQTGKSMTTYQKNVLGFALIILLPLCFFIYLQKSDDVVVRFIVSSLQWEDTWAEEWYIVASKTRNDPEKQIKRYSSALKFKPNFSEAYSARAGIKRNRLKDYKGAIQDYNKAIESKPHYYSNINRGEGYYINLYIWRGSAKEKLKDYKGAIKDYTKAIELNPTDDRSRSSHDGAYKRRGVAKGKLGDYKGEIADNIKSKERRTELRNSYYTEIRKKMKLYTKAIELNPNDTDAYYKRGSAKSKLQDYKGAIKDNNKAIELNPNFAMAYLNRGAAKGGLQDYKGAIEDYNKAIELNPDYALAYANRGNAKIRLGQKDDGCLDLSKAEELGFAEGYEAIKKYCN